MARYKVERCNNCSKNSRAMPSSIQNYLATLLLILGIIPGIIYWFLSTGKHCHICGVKYKASKK